MKEPIQLLGKIVQQTTLVTLEHFRRITCAPCTMLISIAAPRLQT